MSRNVNIEELITLNYEIEGLLYMALHRGSDTPEGVWRLIKEKVNSLNVALSDEDSYDISQPGDETQEAIDLDSNNIIEEPETSETDQSGSFEPDEETISGDYATPAKEIVMPDVEVVNSAENADSDVIPSAEDESEEADEVADADISVDEESVDAEVAQEMEPVIRLDEKLARDNSKNLRKAFSVNDKFRFRRELFSNSDTEMTDTLNIVEAMSSYPEAEEYFFTDLQWDPDLAEVADFMAIIKKHFS